MKDFRNLSRRRTHMVVTGTYGLKKHEIKNKSCKKCRSIDNLQIHHEIYPDGAWCIRKAIDQGKIYYLCLKCHNEIHRELKKLEKEVLKRFFKEIKK